MKYILYEEAVERQDYNLPELALSDRTHRNIIQRDRFVFPVQLMQCDRFLSIIPSKSSFS